MSLWFLSAITTAVTIDTIALFVLWRRYYGRQRTLSLTPEVIEPLLRKLAHLGFGRVRQRGMLGGASLLARREHEEISIALELGDAQGQGFTRMTFGFEQPLNQGIEILWEERPGLRWMLRWAEIELEDERLDPKFIMLARDAERFELLMTERVRRELLALEEGAFDLQVTDQAIYVAWPKVLKGSAIERALAQGVRLGRALMELALEHGPIEDFDKEKYSTTTTGYARSEEETTAPLLDLLDAPSDEHHTMAMRAVTQDSRETTTSSTTSSTDSEEASSEE